MERREKEKEREKKEAAERRGGSQADKAPSDWDEEEEEEEESSEMEESECEESESEEERERRVSLRRRTSERAGRRDWKDEMKESDEMGVWNRASAKKRAKKKRAKWTSEQPSGGLCAPSAALRTASTMVLAFAGAAIRSSKG